MLVHLFQNILCPKKKKTPKQEEQETFYHALCHDNVSLIEVLVEQGFDFSFFSYNSQSALLCCLEKRSVKTLEYLLIMSMRKNQLFLYKDLMKVLNWSLETGVYKSIEITLYALKQEREQDSALMDFVTVKDYFSSLCEILKQQNALPEHQISHFSSLVKKHPLTKRQLNYLYYLWEKDFPPHNPHSLEMYKVLADEYDKLDHLLHLSQSYDLVTKITLKTVLIVFATAFTLWESVRIFGYGLNFIEQKALSFEILFAGGYDKALLCFSLYLGLMAGILWYFIKCLKKVLLQFRENTQRQKSRLLLHQARLGHFDEVVRLIEEQRAHKNSIGGIACSTALFEVARMGNPTIERYLEGQGCYKMKKSLLL